eukprot:2399758-Rhodomonas_salina.2
MGETASQRRGLHWHVTDKSVRHVMPILRPRALFPHSAAGDAHLPSLCIICFPVQPLLRLLYGMLRSLSHWLCLRRRVEADVQRWSFVVEHSVARDVARGGKGQGADRVNLGGTFWTTRYVKSVLHL